MEPAHIPVILSQKTSTKSRIIRPAILFLAWEAHPRLRQAALNGDVALARAELEAGVAVDQANVHGETPLYTAARQGAMPACLRDRAEHTFLLLSESDS